MREQIQVLVVDDDKKIRTMLVRYLSEEGFRAIEAADGTEMRAALGREKINLVLLDLLMPGEDGLSLARYIRQHLPMPIIMLTGKGDLIDRVAGLEAGADDYIPKPFHLREVLARIRTVLRRTQAPTAPAPAPASTMERSEILVFEGWRFDVLRRELRRQDGNAVSLTAAEFDLLSAFLRNPNRVLSRDQLMNFVKGRDWAAFDRAIDTQVVRLRRKIEVHPQLPQLIKTVRGAGYIFSVPVTAE